MPTSTQVSITGGCCCIPEECCNDVEMPEELCVTPSVAGGPCDALPSKIKISKVGAREWFGEYCLRECNLLWDARLACVVNPFTGVGVWQFTIRVTACFGGVLITQALTSLGIPGGGMNAAASCTLFVWSGANLAGSIALGGQLCQCIPGGAISTISYTINALGCPDNNVGTGSGTGTDTDNCIDCPGTGSGTGTSTGTSTGTATGVECPCDTGTLFCFTDGTESITLSYAGGCLWAGTGAEIGTADPTVIVFDPTNGTVRRGTFPSNYADYAGTPGECGAQMFFKTFEAGVGPHPDVISNVAGACP